MLIRKAIILLATGLTVLAGCSKKDGVSNSNSTTPAEQDDCMQGASVDNGDIIEGQYIVMYKPGAVNARGVSLQKLDDISENTLTRHAISKGALKKSFD